MIETPGVLVGWIIVWISVDCKNALNKVCFCDSGSSPSARVAFACASASTSRAVNPNSAKAAARETAVVVFATPPFSFAMEILNNFAPDAHNLNARSIVQHK